MARPTCPECGTSQPERVPRLPQAGPGLRLVVGALAILAACTWIASSYERTRASSGVLAAQYVPGAITRGMLREYASGTGVAYAPLIDALRTSVKSLPYSPGETKLLVACGAPPNVRSRSLQFGFPVPCIVRTREEAFENALTGLTPVPIYTDESLRTIGQFETVSSLPNANPRPRVALWGGAGGTLALHPAPENTGGALITTWIMIPSLTTNIACGVLLALGLSLLWRRVRRATPRTRRLAGAIALALGIIGAMSVITSATTTAFGRPQWASVKQATFPPAMIYWHQDPFVMLPLTLREIDALRGTPDGEARVAQAILDTCPETPSESDVLALWAVPELYCPPTPTAAGDKFNYWMTSIGTVRRLDMDRHPLHGTGTLDVLPPEGVRFERTTLQIGMARSGRFFVCSLLLGPLLALACYAIVGSWLTLLIARLVMGRRARRRAAAGCCTSCGYSLA